MAFPTTGVLFNFASADAAPMTGWTDIYNGISASGGVAVGSNTSDANVSRTNTSYGADSEIYATITTKPPNATSIGLFVRMDSGGSNGYFVVAITNSGTDEFRIFRFDGGSPTQLGSTVSQEFSTGDKFGIEAIGTSIKAYRLPSGGSWGQIGSTQTDGTYSAAGYLMAQIDLTAAFDDLGGGTVVVGGVVVPIFMRQYRARRV